MTRKQLKKARKMQDQKAASGDTFTATLRPLARYIKASLPAGLLLSAGTAFAGPQGGQVVGGQGSITQPDANTTVINQASSRLSVDWTSFNVSQSELVQFNQPSKAASALNRIYDQNPSQIHGSIRANGNVLLVNPNGVFFGPTASVNVNSLIASGLDVKTEDFMASKYNFEAPVDAEGGLVVNQGILQAATGGSINLVGGAVKNEGVILAIAGQVNLVAGNKVTMDFDGDGLIQFAVDKEILQNVHDLDDAISNTGEVAAEGGAVLLKGSAAKDVFSNVVNNSGVIRAGRIENKGGQIKLIAGGRSNSLINTGTLDATGYGGDGGTIEIYATEDITITGDSVVTANASAAEGSTISLINGELTIRNYNAGSDLQISEGDYVAITKATGDTQESIAFGSVSSEKNLNISATSDNTVVITGSDYNAETTAGNINVSFDNLSADKNITLSTQGTFSIGAGTTEGLTSVPDTVKSSDAMEEEGAKGGIISLTAGNKTVISRLSQITATSDQGAGGSVRLLADKVGVFDSALVDVSGDQGGGEVLVGGDFQGRTADILNATQTIVSPDAVIRADAIREGNGGKVIVWSDVSTLYYGDISARGGSISGDGGFVEVSGKKYLGFKGYVDTRAVNGELGTLLLDPKNIVIEDSGTGTEVATLNFADASDPVGGTSRFDGDDLAALDANLLLEASNDITINEAIPGTTTSGRIYTFRAGRSVLINANITSNNGQINILANSTSALGVVDGDRDPGNAAITMADGTTINAGNANIIVQMLDGSGNTNSDSGDITLENLTTTGHIRIVNDGTTLGSDILRTSADSLLTALSVILHISDAANTTGVIGASGTQINMDTTNLELETQGGSAFINENDALIIGGASLGSLTGVNVGSGNLSITAGGAVTDTESIIATGLAITSAGATLDVASNNITTLSVAMTGEGNSFSFTDEADGFTVGTVDGVVGITTAATATSGTASGDITLSTTAGDITITNNISTGVATVAEVGVGTNAQSGDIQITAGGSGVINGAGTLITGGATVTAGNGDDTATAGGITLNANEISSDGTNSLNITLGTANSNGGTDVSNKLNVTTDGTGAAGEIKITSAGTVVVDVLNTTDADTTNVEITGNVISVESASDLDIDNIILTADEIDLNSTITAVGGSIVLQTNTSSESIGIAGGTGTLDLSTTDLGNLANGFTSITIGRSDGNGLITANSHTFLDPLTLRSPITTGSININGTLTAPSIVLTAGTTGNLTLAADLQTDGDITITGQNIILGAATVSLITDNSADGAAGNITLVNTTVSGNTTGRDLVLNASAQGGTNQNGGNVSLGTFGTTTAYVNDLTINTSATGSGTAGILTLNADISLDDAPADLVDFILIGVTDIRLQNSVIIDTEQGNFGSAGSLDFSNANISANSAGLDLTLNTNTTFATGNGGAVSLGAFGSAGGNFINDLTITTTGLASGTVTFSDAVTITNNATVNSQGNITFNGTLTAGGSIDLDSVGSISVTAGQRVIASGSAITMDAAGITLGAGTLNNETVTNTGTGAISLTSTGTSNNLGLNNFSIRLADGALTLNASGFINETVVNTNTNISTSGSLTLSAGSGIGTTGAIDVVYGGGTSLDLNLTRTGNGNIDLNITGDTTLNGFVSGGFTGDLSITTGSFFTYATDVIQAGSISQTTTDVSGMNDDITVNAGVTVRSTGGNVTFNAGDDIVLQAGAIVDTTGGTGTVSLTAGVGATGAQDDIGQIELIGNSTVTSANTAGIAISLIANDLTLSGTSSINASGGAGSKVLITTSDDTDTIDLGLADSLADNVLEISDADMDVITAESLRIGSTSAGNITVSSAINPGGAVTNLSLLTGGSISQGVGDTITVTGLRIEAGASITLGQANDFDTLAASITNTSDFSITDADGFAVGSVDTRDGVTTADGQIFLNATTGNIDVTNVGGAADDISASGANGNVIVNVFGNDAFFNIAAGAEVVASNTVTITADDVDLQGTINAGGSNAFDVRIKPFNATDAVDIGSAGVTANNTLELSNAEIENITANTLQVGESTGTLTVSAAITTPNITNLTLIADEMAIANTVDVSGGITTLRSQTAARTIDLGVVGDTGADLDLSSAELDNITATTIRVGGATAGAISITADITGANYTNLHLISNSTVTGNAGSGGGIIATGLAVEANGAVDITDANTDVDLVAINTPTGNIFFTDTDGFSVSTIDTVAGVDTNSGTVTLTATSGPITIINTGAANDVAASGLIQLLLVADEALLTISAGAEVESTGGDVVAVADKMALDGTIRADGGSNQRVTLRAENVIDDDAINFETNATGDGTAQTLQLEIQELANVFTDTLQIGQSDAGAITINTDVTGLSVTELHLTNDSTVTGTSGGIAVTNLAIEAGGVVNITDAQTAFTVLAVSNAGQTVTIVESDGFSVGVVDGVVGVTGSNIVLTATTGNLTVSDATGDANSDVTATGTVGLTTSADNGLLTIAAGANVTGTGGTHTYISDKMAITGTVTATNQRVILESTTATDTIDLGSAVDNTSNTVLELSDTELDNITASILEIGDATNAGAISVSVDISPANITTLHLKSSAGVSGAGIDLVDTTGRLAVTAGGAVNLVDAQNEVSFLAVTTGGTASGVSFTDSNALTIGTVDGVSGVTTGDGVIAVTVGAALTIQQNVTNTGANDINLVGVGIDVDTTTGGAHNVTVSTTSTGDLIVNAGSGTLLLQDEGTNEIALLTTTGTGNISIVADNLDIETNDGTNQDQIVSGGTLTIAPNNGDTIGLGDDAITATSDLELSDAEMDALVAAGTLTIGNNMSGRILLDRATTFGANDLTLITDGFIADNSAGNAFTSTGTLTLISGANGTAGSTIGTDNAGNNTDTTLLIDVNALTITSSDGENINVTDAGTSNTLYNIDTGGAGNVVVTQSVNDLQIGVVNTTGDVALTTMNTTGGAIVDNAADNTVNIFGATVTLTSNIGIGSSTADQDIETSATTLVASTTTSGDIVIDETNALIIGTGGNGISTVANGNIVVVADGTVTVAEVVSANGAGDVTLTVNGAMNDIAVNANITTATGDINLTAADAIGNGGGDIIATTDGSGTTQLRAGNAIGVLGGVALDIDVATVAAALTSATATGDIALNQINGVQGDLTVGTSGMTNGLTTMNGSSIQLLTQAGNGDLTIVQAVTANGSGNIDLRTLGMTADINVNGVTVSSTTGDIQVIAGQSILTNTATNMTTEFLTGAGGSLLLSADDAIGTTTNRIDTDLPLVAAALTGAGATGDIFINQVNGTTDPLEIGTATGLNASGNLSGIVTTNNRNITVATQAGTLTVTDTVSANGSGDVTLTANQLLVVNAVASSGTGALSLTGGTGVTHGVSGDLTTGGAGTIGVTATAGNVTMVDGTVYTATGGQVDVTGAINVALGRIAGGGVVNVTATTGGISDVTAGEGTGAENIAGTVVTLTAGTGIGATGGAGDIDTAATELDLTSTTGGIFIAETDGVQLGNGTGGVNTVTSGKIEIIAGGAITTGNTITTAGAGNIDVSTTGGSITLSNALSANGAGTVTIDANGNQADIISTAAGTIVSGSGLITLNADDDVTLAGTVGSTGTSVITVTADVDGTIGAGETGLLNNTAVIGNVTSGTVSLTGETITANNNVLSGNQIDITSETNTTFGTVTVNVAGGAATINIRVDNSNAVAAQLDLGNATLTAGTAVNLTGGTAGGNDILVAQNLVNTWTITGADIGTLSNTQINAGGAPLAAYSNLQNLIGNANTDLFDFDGGTVSGNIDGQGGTDTLDFAGAGAVTVSLTGLGTTDGFAGTSTNITGTFDDVNTLVGSTGTDTLIGQNAAATWTVNGGGTTYNSTNVLTFSAFENLTGNGGVDVFNVIGAHTGNLSGAGGADDFNFNAGAVTGNIDGGTGNDIFDFNGGTVTGNVDGQAGTDSLDYADVAGPITVTITGLGATDGFAGITTSVTGTFDNINDLEGTASNTDNLVSTVNTDTTVTVQAGNDNFVNGGRTLTFDTLNNITTAGGNDTLTINETHIGNLATGDGNNSVAVNAGLTGNITSNAGDDDIAIAAAMTGNITDSGGTNSLTVAGSITGDVSTAAGNDTISFTGSLTGDLTDAGGTNTVTMNTVTGNVNTGAGVDTITFNGVVSGSLTDGGGNNIVRVNNNVAGAVTLGAGNDNLTIANNVTGNVNTGGGNDTINFSSGVLSGNITAGSGTNIYNHNGGRTTGSVSVVGNDTWNHVNGVSLGSGVTGTGNLTVPNAVTGDLGIEAAGLNLPAMNSFAGHLIIGGTIESPNLPLDGTKMVTVNTALLSVNSPITTDGDVTLLGQSVDLNSNISAGGIGGNQVAIFATGDGSGATATGNITGVAIPTNVQAGNVILVAANTIQQSENIELELGGGDLVVSIAEGQDAPQFGLLDAVAVEPAGDLANFLALDFNIAGVGGLLLNTQANLDVSQANLAGNLIGLEQLAFIDTGLFEEDLSLFGVIGQGVALSLAQCEEAEGCAPDVTDEELNELISGLQARIDELDRRLLEEESAKGRTEIEELRDSYKKELDNFEKYKEDLAAFYAAEEAEWGDEDDDGFGDEFGEVDTIESQVKTLSEILEVTQQRIDWLESLKADPDARAKLSEATKIELTIEVLDEIIEATKQEVQFIESQIKLLLEGTEASLDPIFWAESGDQRLIQNIQYGPPYLLNLDESLIASSERWY